MGFSLLGLGLGDGVMYSKQKNSMVLLENYHECNHIRFIKHIVFNVFFFVFFLFVFEKMGPPWGCFKVGFVVRSNIVLRENLDFLARARIREI